MTARHSSLLHEPQARILVRQNWSPEGCRLILTLSLSLLLAVKFDASCGRGCEGGTKPSIHVIAESTSVSVAADFRLPEIK